MGGKAFSKVYLARNGRTEPMTIPRLSPETYQQVAADIRPKLEKLFKQVAIPREPPGKSDYGDVDFLVQGIIAENGENKKDILLIVKELLGAEFRIEHSFAVKHPTVYGAYVQVDVEVLSNDDTDLFEWTKFMKGDSDLVQIIGVLHRSIGLTCNDRGLCVRVEEVESFNKKKSLVVLTNDPNKALDFYGYDKAKYWQGFDSEMEMFDWATSGRFFSWRIYKDRIENANDRARKMKRPMFSRFIEDYMPSSGKATVVSDEPGNTNGNKDDQALATRSVRQKVLEEALRTFNKQEEYDAKIVEFETKGFEDALWKTITTSIPQPHGCTIQGLKRWVGFKDGRPYILTQPLSKSAKLRWTDHFSKATLPYILVWVDENREQIRRLEEERVNEARSLALKK